MKIKDGEMDIAYDIFGIYTRIGDPVSIVYWTTSLGHNSVLSSPHGTKKLSSRFCLPPLPLQNLPPPLLLILKWSRLFLQDTVLETRRDEIDCAWTAGQLATKIREEVAEIMTSRKNFPLKYSSGHSICRLSHACQVVSCDWKCRTCRQGGWLQLQV